MEKEERSQKESLGAHGLNVLWFEMQMNPKRMIGTFIVLLLIVLLGCTQEAVRPVQKHGFSSEVSAIKAAYSEAGISGQELQAIDSKKLLARAEKASLLERLSAAEQKLNSVLDRAKTIRESSEKSELLKLLSLEFSRLSYYKSMVRLKDLALFQGLASAISSTDFNSLEAGKCTGLEQAGEIEKQYFIAEYSAGEFERQANEFTASFPGAASELGIDLKKPSLADTGLGEIVKTGVLLSDACSDFSEASRALKELQQVSTKGNICFFLPEIKKNISSLSRVAGELDSLSKKASSIDSFSPKLSAKAKELLSVSTEMNDFYSRLEQGCK